MPNPSRTRWRRRRWPPVLDLACRCRSARRGREDPRRAAMVVVVVVVVVVGFVPATSGSCVRSESEARRRRQG